MAVAIIELFEEVDITQRDRQGGFGEHGDATACLTAHQSGDGWHFGRCP